MNNNTRMYLRINTKELTATEYFIATDDFGKPYIKHSFDILPYGECKKYVVPVLKFIDTIAEYRRRECNELCEYLECSFDKMMEQYRDMIFR